MSYEKHGNLWVSDNSVPTGNKKGWQDVLYSVRNNRLEEWDISTAAPYKNNHIVRRGVDLLVESIASIPLDIYKGDKIIPSPNHPVYKLFIKPSEDVCRFELFEKLAKHLFLSGESFFYLNLSNQGTIQEIYVLHPKYMKHEKCKETGQIKSWVFNSKIPMSKEQVIHFKLSNPDSLRGISPLTSVATDLGTEDSASKYGKAFFDNSADPGGYLKVDAKSEIQPDEMRRVVQEWNSLHRGVEHGYKVAGLLGGMEYVPSTGTHSEMQFTEIRTDIRDRLLTVLGLSKAVLGITDDVNRSSARESMRALWELTLKPHLVRIQQKLDAELFMPYFPGYHCKFDLSSVDEIQKDLNKLLDISLKLRDMGYTRNEINFRLNLDMPDSKDEDDLIKKILVRRADLSKLTEVKPKVEADPKKDEPKPPKPKPEPKKDLGPLRKEFRSKLKTYFFKLRKSTLKSGTINLVTENESLLKTVEPFRVDKNIVDLNICVSNEVRMQYLLGKQAEESDKLINERVKKTFNFLEKRLKGIVDETLLG